MIGGAARHRRVYLVVARIFTIQTLGASQIDDSAVCAGLSMQRERVWCPGTPSLTGSLLDPASAARPPRGMGGGGAMLHRHDRGVLHVQAQTYTRREGALCRQSPLEGRPRQEGEPSSTAAAFEADASDRAIEPTERSHHRRHHAK